jgi:hypothetical protein
MDYPGFPNLTEVHWTSPGFALVAPDPSGLRLGNHSRRRLLLIRVIQAASRLVLKAMLTSHGTRGTDPREGFPSTAA